MAAERLFQFSRIDLAQNTAHRGVSRSTSERDTRIGSVEQRQPRVDQGVNLTVGTRSAQHSDDRKQDHAYLIVHLALRTAAVRDRREARHKINGSRHGATF